jgi:hypothetical protein
MLEARLRAEAEGHETADELPFEEGEAEGSSEMPADSSDVGAGENKEPSDDAFDASDIGNGGENQEDNSTDWYDDWSERDFDLNEVIAELEKDVTALEGDEEEESEEDEEEEESEESDDEEESDEDEEEEEEMESDEEEEKSDEEESKSEDSDDKKPMKLTFEDFMNMLHEAGFSLEEMGAHQEYPNVDPVHSATTPQHSSEIGDGGENVESEDLNLEEILAMLEAEDASIHEETEASDTMAFVKALQTENAEYRQAIDVLRGKLNEVNLLNAKLLFTNKIFRKQGLTNEQKIAIVENFDRATTVREVKMVYAVLAETLNGQAVQSKVKLPRKVVAEGLASKPMKSTAPKVESKEIISENSFAKRLQELAGIIS